MSETLSDSQHDPIDWMRRYLGTINSIVYNTSTSKFLLNKGNSGEDILNTTSTIEPNLDFHITESSICLSWLAIEKQIPLPHGFKVASGYVDLGDSVKHEHTYLQSPPYANDFDPNRRILCFSAAQFMPGGEKGDKIIELQERARKNGMPELVTRIGNFLIVYGKANDIKRSLKLAYRNYPFPI